MTIQAASPLPRLAALSTAVPPCKLAQADIRTWARTQFQGRVRDIDRMLPAFDNAGIDTRYSCMPLDWFSKPRGNRHAVARRPPVRPPALPRRDDAPAHFRPGMCRRGQWSGPRRRDRPGAAGGARPVSGGGTLRPDFPWCGPVEKQCHRHGIVRRWGGGGADHHGRSRPPHRQIGRTYLAQVPRRHGLDGRGRWPGRGIFPRHPEPGGNGTAGRAATLSGPG